MELTNTQRTETGQTHVSSSVLQSHICVLFYNNSNVDVNFTWEIWEMTQQNLICAWQRVDRFYHTAQTLIVTLAFPDRHRK